MGTVTPLMKYLATQGTGLKRFFYSRTFSFKLLAIVLIGVAAATLPACGADSDSLTVYSGRSETLVSPLLEAFNEDTGIDIQVKYASSATIASTVLEEGDNSPADVVFLQDPGYLGSLAHAGMLAELPEDVLSRVDSGYRSADGDWVGTSGRSRSLVYNTAVIDPEKDLPDSILDFTAPEWKGRVGWAPVNASFQAFLTAFRLKFGEDAAREWLQGMQANDVREYSNNTTIVLAVARREVDVGFVNHYYLQRFLEEEGEEFEARNHFFGGGDPGALVLAAGAAVLETTDNRDAAESFVEYLLSESAQTYFSTTTKEYPLVEGVPTDPGLPPLSSLEPPEVDLGDLTDARGTISLLREVGIIP